VNAVSHTAAAEIMKENVRSVTGKLVVTIVSADGILAQDDDGVCGTRRGFVNHTAPSCGA
jgi:hypothetical protein